MVLTSQEPCFGIEIGWDADVGGQQGLMVGVFVFKSKEIEGFVWKHSIYSILTAVSLLLWNPNKNLEKLNALYTSQPLLGDRFVGVDLDLLRGDKCCSQYLNVPLNFTWQLHENTKGRYEQSGLYIHVCIYIYI